MTLQGNNLRVPLKEEASSKHYAEIIQRREANGRYSYEIVTIFYK